MQRRRHLIYALKIVLDLSVLGTAFCLAFLLRFEGALPDQVKQAMLAYLPLVVAGKMVLLAGAGRLRLAWRYTSLRDTLCFFHWSAAATLLLLAIRFSPEAWTPSKLSGYPVPVGVALLDLVLSFLGLAGMRVGVRMWNEHRERKAVAPFGLKPVPTLLIGAGRAGAVVAQEIAACPHIGIKPVGFLDDDPSLCGMSVAGLPVLGTTAELLAVTKRHQVGQALITIANRSGSDVRRMVQACEASGLVAKIIPSLHEIMEGRINLSGIRKVAIEDLLRRAPVQLDGPKLKEIVTGKVVLVTGAGGSIGSELCRVLGSLSPRSLILVERAENSLFHIHLRLRAMFPKLDIMPCIADIADEDRLESIFTRHRPSLLLHAAAHKHVPMMEWNPSEAVKNNILGTRTIACLADAWGVDRFVMISTDKAVNPSSVMGASKRVAELLIQSFAQTSSTRFMTVRFGNVLGSAGSVIPIFQEQIAGGGPVTVTHPEMKRYFMTIPEACQLVLQAGAMGLGGEIFILDMGEPVKIVDIARDLIRLSGLAPDRDIEIRFTGMRPGEKLFEELFLGEENAQKTQHPRIFIGQVKAPTWSTINRLVSELGKLAATSDAGSILAKLKEIVPEYQYQSLRCDAPADVSVKPRHVAVPLATDPVPERVVLGNQYT